MSISPLIIVAPDVSVFAANLWNESRISSRSLKKSRCSASIFNMILYFGLKFKKLFVYSHASDTKYSDEPTLRLPWIAERIPPTVIVGSVSA